MKDSHIFLATLLIGTMLTLAGITWHGPSTAIQATREDCFSGVDSSWFGTWCPTSETATNAFYLWRTSPIVKTLAESPSIELSEHALEQLLNGFLLFIGFFGLGAIFSRSRDPAAQQSFASYLGISCVGALGAVTTVVLMGHDRVALSTTALVPLVATSLLLPFSSLWVRNVVLLGLGFLLALSANQLAPLAAVVAILGAFLFRRFNPSPALVNTQDYSSLVPILAFPFLALFIGPSFEVPWYPQGTQVVPDDEIPGMLRPFVGPLPPVPFIDRLALKEFFTPAFRITLIGFFVTFAFLARAKNRTLLLLMCGLPLMLLYISLRLPEPMSIISPLLVIPRIIPGWFFFPFEGITLAVSLIGLTGTLLTTHRLLPALGLVVSLVAALTWEVPRWNAPTPREAASLWTNSDLFDKHWRLLRSPSQFVLRAHHWDALGENENWILTRGELIEHGEFTALQESDASVTASHNQDLTNLVFRQNSKTRWTSGNGEQKGDEWFHIRFNHTETLDGVELSLGDFVTDFPRGLKVLVSDDCSENEPTVPESRLYRLLLEYPVWYGGLGITPQGYPYFRGRYSMKLFFPKSESLRCILFKQTSQTEGADWSVSTIRVLRTAATNP